MNILNKIFNSITSGLHYCSKCDKMTTHNWYDENNWRHFVCNKCGCTSAVNLNAK